MLEVIRDMVEHTFMQRAIIVGLLVSLCAALLGVSLVLKRYSMLGDGLSHVGFAIITVSTVLGFTSPLYISIPGVILTAIILLKLGNNRKMKADSSIALISTSALATGVIITDLTTGLNTDICNFMFGSILAMTKTDVYLSIVVSIIVVLLFIIYYRKIFIITFDEEFGKASGLKTGRYTMLLAILTAVTIVVGMRMMGTLLISSIIIFPALTSMRVFKTFKTVILSSVVVSISAFLIGVLLSYIFNMSTGATIVIVNLILFIIFNIIEKILNE